MSTINIWGGETGDTSELHSGITGTGSIQGTTVRSGSFAFRANPTTTAVGWIRLGTPSSTGSSGVASVANSYIRFYFRYATKPSSNSEEIMDLLDSAGRLEAPKFSIRINSSGNLVAYDKDISVLGTGSTVLAADTWYMIECLVGTGTSASWAVKIDEVSEISGTGNLLTNNAGYLRLGKVTNRNGNTVDFFYDDVCWDDAGYPGPGAVLLLKPNANGNYQTWTALGLGDHYVEVDEIPHDSDTSYLYTPLIGLTADTEGLQSGADVGIAAGDTVNCVKNFAIVKRGGASNGAVTLRLRSGSTDSDTGSNYATTNSYFLISKLYDTDPATSAAWATSAIDSLESGCVSQDSTNQSRMTSCGVMVDYTPATAQIINVNQIAETDTTQSPTRLKSTGVGQISEADSSQQNTRLKSKALELTSEGDSTQLITSLKSNTLGILSESNSAPSVTWSPKIRILGVETESNQSIAIGSLKIIAVGFVEESGTSQQFTHSKQITIAQNSESDEPFMISAGRVFEVSQVLEDDTVHVLEASKLIGLSFVEESDTPFGVSRVVTVTTNQVLEADIAQTVLWNPKNRIVQLVSETDAVNPLTTFIRQVSVHPVVITLREDRMWQFEWRDIGAPYYRIVLYGHEVARTSENSYVYPLPGWETFPPFLEIIEGGL